jgi:hypothetical protein
MVVAGERDTTRGQTRAGGRDVVMRERGWVKGRRRGPAACKGCWLFPKYLLYVEFVSGPQAHADGPWPGRSLMLAFRTQRPSPFAIRPPDSPCGRGRFELPPALGATDGANPLCAVSSPSA